MNSFISEMPGPAVGVNARAPAHDGANHHADGGQLVLGLDNREAVLLRLFGSRRYFWQKPLNASISEVAGVIGYHAPTVAPA